MMRRATVLLTAMVAAIVMVSGMALSQTAPPVSPQYTIKNLGTLCGDSCSFVSSSAADVNDSGQVVGDSSTQTPGTSHAFSYSGDVMRDLGTLDGDSSSGALGINDSGEVVGASHAISPDGNVVTRAFLYSGGVMQDLGSLGGTIGWANDVNDSGQIVGGSETASAGFHAFLYSGGRMQDLGTLGGGSAQALDINDSGEVVGESTTSNGTTLQHAFLYSGGRMQDLGTLGGPFSKALDINNAGEIVVVAETSTREDRAFLYSGGVMQDLGTLPGDTISWANAVNDSGQIVGYSQGVALRAFLYSDGQMQDLNSLIPADSGWRLLRAEAINTSGQIVGAGLLNGQFRAFLATPNTDTTLPQLNLPNTLSQTATSPDGATVSYIATATDDVDGNNLPVDCSPASGSTFPLGATTVNCSAEDAAGNVATGSFEVRVVYDFGNGSGGGFSPPVSSSALNEVKGGAGVPLKFGLGGDFGLDIFAAGYPTSRMINCEPGLPTELVEETVTVSVSGLRYDASAGQYIYIWRTDKAWSGTCRELVLKLKDGSEHTAKFIFK